MTRWLSLLFLFSVGYCHQYLSPFDFLKYEQATINAGTHYCLLIIMTCGV